MNWNWQEFKNSDRFATKLYELLQDYSTRDLAAKFDINKETIRYHAYQNNIEYINGDWVKQQKEMEYKNGVLVDEINGTYYFDYDNIDFAIDKSTLDDIYYDYCELSLTQQETADRNNLSIDEFEIVKKAYNLTHKDLPLSDETILEQEPEQSVREILRNKKKRISELKPVEEIKYLRKIADKYFENQYEIDEIIDNINEFPKVEIEDPEISYDKSSNVMIVALSDLHYGKKVISEQIIANNEFNSDEFEKRLNYYLSDVIEGIQKHKPKKVYIVNLGDISDDPQSDTYPGQVYNQDKHGVEQIMGCVKHIAQFIKKIAHLVETEYITLPGNHSDDRLNADILIGRILEEIIDGIKFDNRDKPYKQYEINGNYFIFNHGNNISNSKNKKENNILNIIHSFGLRGERVYFITGHLHHESEDGVNYEHKKCPSLVGGDNLSSNIIQAFSRPAQMYFVVTEKGMEDRHKTYLDMLP